MEKQSFTDWFNSAMAENGWSQRDLADRARVSYRAISEARSGKLEEMLKSESVGVRKKVGVAQSTYRLLLAFDQNPREWMDELGLEIPKQATDIGRKFEGDLKTIWAKPLTAEDIELFGRVQKELGELFSIEMALRILVRKHLEL